MDPKSVTNTKKHHSLQFQKSIWMSPRQSRLPKLEISYFSLKLDIYEFSFSEIGSFGGSNGTYDVHMVPNRAQTLRNTIPYNFKKAYGYLRGHLVIQNSKFRIFHKKLDIYESFFLMKLSHLETPVAYRMSIWT